MHNSNQEQIYTNICDDYTNKCPDRQLLAPKENQLYLTGFYYLNQTLSVVNRVGNQVAEIGCTWHGIHDKLFDLKGSKNFIVLLVGN